MMREKLLAEIEEEYVFQRKKNEKEEAIRRENIRVRYPAIEELVEERENLVFSTIRCILGGNAGKTDNPSFRMDELNGKILAMLAENGFSANYLEPVYRCAKCKDTGYTGDIVREPCECLKKSYQEKLRKLIGLDRNREETFSSYDESMIPEEVVTGSGITQRQLTRIAKEQCEKWANAYPAVDHRDILITGGSGLGKTFLMRSMASRLLDRGQNVLLISAYTFLQMARKSYFDSEDGIVELMLVPVLMLDDLGSEPLMQNITVEQLFFLINERQSRNLSTIISSNLTLQELRERYTERIVSRLNNPKNCIILTLAGRDLRKIER